MSNDGPQWYLFPNLLYVTLYRQRNFPGVINLRIFIWGKYSGLSGWTQCDYKGLSKREERGSTSEEAMIEKEVGVKFFEDRRSQKQRRQATSRGWEGQGHKFFPENIFSSRRKPVRFSNFVDTYYSSKRN